MLADDLVLAGTTLVTSALEDSSTVEHITTLVGLQ